MYLNNGWRHSELIAILISCFILVYIVQAVTRFKLESQSKHSECTRHHQFNMQLIMWCEECNKKICPLCALEDTHKDHKVSRTVTWIYWIYDYVYGREIDYS